MAAINKDSFSELFIDSLLNRNIEITKTFSKKCTSVFLNYISDQVSSGKSFKVAKGYFIYAKAKSSRVGYDFHKNETVEILPLVSVRIVKKSMSRRLLLKDIISDLQSLLVVSELFAAILVKTLYKCVESVVSGENLILFKGFGYFKSVIYESTKHYIHGKGFVDLPARNGIRFKVSRDFRTKCELSGCF